MNKKEMFIIICPKCNSTNVQVYYSIYDEIVCKCNDCKYDDSAYSK
jgi:transcription initiation factor TFIIIB Brf1 subunit/transcription initiation factor TFIIB